MGAAKVCTPVVLVLVTSRASSTVSFMATMTPRPLESGSEAVTTALYRLSGPSALMAVEGRMAPTSTTGLSLLTVRLRK
ncbi:hypothetical protein D3C79_981070 [compost metagenome]